MVGEDRTDLTFESLLTDPLIRLVMDADGVTTEDLVSVMRIAAVSRSYCNEK